MKKFELNIGYDADLGRIWWNDFLNENEHLKFYHCGSLDYLVLFAEGEKEKAAFDRNMIEEKDFEELLELAESFDLFTNGADKEDLINELMFVTNEQYYKHHYENTAWCNLESDFIARGYSQGDAVAVNLVGKVEVTQEQIEHLLYDSPIMGMLTIYEAETGANTAYLSDVEWVEVDQIWLEEYLIDYYDWDKGEFLVNFEKDFDGEDKAALLRFLEKELPENLSY